MRAEILDAHALRAVSPLALAGFARSAGWVKSEPYGRHSDVYTGHDKPEIVLPRTDTLGDYPTVVADLLTIFAADAELDELAVYRDLSCADRDVIRVRAAGDDSGSIPIETGVNVITNSYQLLLAAACATTPAPQPVYRARREVSEYLDRVRLGQTEQGSFVVTLLAPVPPRLEAAQAGLWPGFEDEPFERQVTRRLAEALQALRGALELATSGDEQAFDRAVRDGVSANLCEAISGLLAKTSGVDIALTWARTRPTPERIRRVGFTANDSEILTEAARLFRSRQPRLDQSLFGKVESLKRKDEEIEGAVTLRALVDEKPYSIRAVLDPTSYSFAVKAHDKKSPILVRGDLHRIGERWQLMNARLVATLEEEEDREARTA